MDQRTPFKLTPAMEAELSGQVDDLNPEGESHQTMLDWTIASGRRQASSQGQGHDSAPAVALPQQTIDQILAERKTTHGEYTTHAMISQSLKRVMRATEVWERLSDVQKESLEMNAHKVGRILNGNPNYRDHWDDIAGYARLAADRIEQ